ncbi:MAG: hypothetical protein WC707_00210 [Candidatus Babeliaceae bacterium]
MKNNMILLVLMSLGFTNIPTTSYSIEHGPEVAFVAGSVLVGSAVGYGFARYQRMMWYNTFSAWERASTSATQTQCATKCASLKTSFALPKSPARIAAETGFTALVLGGALGLVKIYLTASNSYPVTTGVIGCLGAVALSKKAYDSCLNNGIKYCNQLKKVPEFNHDNLAFISRDLNQISNGLRQGRPTA